MLTPVNRNPSSTELRKFAVGMLLGFGLLGGLAWWRGYSPTAVTLWSIGVGLAIAAQLPAVGRWIYVGWMTGAQAIGFVMTNILLTLMFFILLPPFALLRLRDPLRKKLGAASYWEQPERHEATLERTSRQF